MWLTLFIVIGGFIYGANYFKFNEEYGNKSYQIGTYYLSFKWWSIKFNWYSRFGEWFVDISATIPLLFSAIKAREYSLVFSENSCKFFTLDIK